MYLREYRKNRRRIPRQKQTGASHGGAKKKTGRVRQGAEDDTNRNGANKIIDAI